LTCTGHSQQTIHDPAAFNYDLAQSLNNLSVLLSGLGSQEDALQVIQEAVKIHEKLAMLQLSIPV